MDPVDELIAAATRDFEMKHEHGNIVVEQLNGIITWHHAEDIKLLQKEGATKNFDLQRVFHPDTYALQISNFEFEVQHFSSSDYEDPDNTEVVGICVLATDNINRVTAAQ